MIDLRVADININKTEDKSELLAICKALSCEVRVDIMVQLRDKALSFTELKALNHISSSAILFHINVLKDAGLIDIKCVPGKKGAVQLCSKAMRQINIDLVERKLGPSLNTVTYTMPIGCYVDAQFFERWGMADSNRNYVMSVDRAFQSERFGAQILWTAGGYIEYAFNNDFALRKEVYELSFSLEICSEAMNYRENWKSDITFSVNGKELLTWTCPGDFGSRRGKLNPAWWSGSCTQYGLLKEITVTENGVYLDGIFQNDAVRLSDLKLSENNRIIFRIENKRDALYYGGFNLFGEKFGDHPQDIHMTAVYKNDSNDNTSIEALQEQILKAP